jgi:DNA-directed RNA polymerase specialized sigma subunit
LNDIDEHLKRCLTGTDKERDRMIFWLYFRQGMSTKEIAPCRPSDWAPRELEALLNG